MYAHIIVFCVIVYKQSVCAFCVSCSDCVYNYIVSNDRQQVKAYLVAVSEPHSPNKPRHEKV